MGKSTISTGPWLQWLYGPSFSVDFSPGLGSVRSAMARGAVATVRRCGDLVHGRAPFLDGHVSDVSASIIQGVTVDFGAIVGDQDLQKRWRIVI